MSLPPFPLPPDLPKTEEELLDAIHRETALLNSYQLHLASLADSRLADLPFTFRRISDDSAHLPRVSIDLKSVAYVGAVDFQVLNDLRHVAIGTASCVHVFQLPIHRQVYSLPLPPSRRLRCFAPRLERSFIVVCEDGAVLPADVRTDAWDPPLAMRAPAVSVQSNPDYLLIRSPGSEFQFLDQVSFRPADSGGFESDIVDSAICAVHPLAVFLLQSGDILVWSIKEHKAERRGHGFAPPGRISVGPRCERIIFASPARTVLVTLDQTTEFRTEFPTGARDVRDSGKFITLVTQRFGMQSLEIYSPHPLEPLAVLTIHGVEVLQVRLMLAAEEYSLVIQGGDETISCWGFTIEQRGLMQAGAQAILMAPGTIAIPVSHCPKAKTARARGRGGGQRHMRATVPQIQPGACWTARFSLMMPFPPPPPPPKRGRKQQLMAPPPPPQGMMPPMVTDARHRVQMMAEQTVAADPGQQQQQEKQGDQTAEGAE
jgi:hypothetical protein